jgi:hypothetical protein
MRRWWSRPGRQVVKSVKKKVLSPGEMAVIKIKKDELPAEKFSRLSVEVAKGDE